MNETTTWATAAEVHMHGDAALEALRDILDGTEPAKPDAATAVRDHFADATELDGTFEDIFAAAVAEASATATAQPWEGLSRP
jgi:hypothetical protein